ncbi:MAG: nucleotide exchange factor GrpE [Rhodospirillales bacterium]|jgi:molecular chaperone GrpE|nr:nucleotide exchange factor GrpE [Rhodospirillales bacterium]
MSGPQQDNETEGVAMTQVEVGEAPAEAAAPAGAEAAAEDQAALDERLAKAETEIAELSEKWKRAMAETENVRRIAVRDREDAGKYAVSRFARDVLSVADNLRRALDSMDKDARATDPGLDALASGVELTERELLATLARYGITPIAAASQPFDPHVHEALFEVPDETVPHGTVVHVLETGYMIHDRPLRPARVGVSKGGPKPGAQPTADQPAGEPGEVVEFPSGGAAGAYGKRDGEAEGDPGSRLDKTI